MHFTQSKIVWQVVAKNAKDNVMKDVSKVKIVFRQHDLNKSYYKEQWSLLTDMCVP